MISVLGVMKAKKVSSGNEIAFGRRKKEMQFYGMVLEVDEDKEQMLM